MWYVCASVQLDKSRVEKEFTFFVRTDRDTHCDSQADAGSDIDNADGRIYPTT